MCSGIQLSFLSVNHHFLFGLFRDALIVPVINCLTSLLGGFVIFAVIGHMAYSSGVEVKKALEAGELHALPGTRHELEAE